VLNCYGHWFDEALVEVSLQGKYWIIEMSYPGSTGYPPAIWLRLSDYPKPDGCRATCQGVYGRR
jgi:hypothetical protein